MLPGLLLFKLLIKMGLLQILHLSTIFTHQGYYAPLFVQAQTDWPLPPKFDRKLTMKPGRYPSHFV
jgi:hypothetical protein